MAWTLVVTPRRDEFSGLAARVLEQRLLFRPPFARPRLGAVGPIPDLVLGHRGPQPPAHLLAVPGAGRLPHRGEGVHRLHCPLEAQLDRQHLRLPRRLGLRGGEEPAAATPGLGQTRSGVHPGGKFVAPDPSPEYDGLEDSKPWSRKASIWERSARGAGAGAPPTQAVHPTQHAPTARRPKACGVSWSLWGSSPAAR